MANYRFALKLHQDQAGSENAKAKITIGGNVVVEELEISATTPTLYTYDVTGLTNANADGSVTTPIKVELLNDYYVDIDTDRNIVWTACGYVQENADGNYYNITDTTDDDWTSSTSVRAAISDFTADASYNWAQAGPHTGDPTGPDGDYSGGWIPLTVNTDYVQATIPLTNARAKTWVVE